MFLDTIHGVIDRRVLMNYRIDPAALQRVLPPPFQPRLYAGHGVGGVCMIRFKQLRPRFMPAWLGLGSENAAHRIAITWEQDGEQREGVFIPRRDTNSWFNKTVGGRVFPGIFQRSRFEARESDTSVSLRIVRADGGTEIAFAGHLAQQLPPTSVFPSLEAAAGFFSLGATGYSATYTEGHYHGMELHSLNWTVAPLVIDEAKSCFFDDQERFPPGAAELDCALLMRGIEHEWHSRPDLYFSSTTSSLTTHRAQHSTGGARGTRCGRNMTLTPRANQALCLAEAEARSLGHPCVGSQHLVLGLFLLGGGVHFSVLQDLRCTEESLRRSIVAIGPVPEQTQTVEGFTLGDSAARLTADYADYADGKEFGPALQNASRLGRRRLHVVQKSSAFAGTLECFVRSPFTAEDAEVLAEERRG